MTIEELLEQIEGALESGTNLAFTSKTLVDAELIKTTIEDIRLNMPEEIKQARSIAAERREILNAAKHDAEATVSDANEQARILVAKAEDRVKTMKERAEELANEKINRAEERARELVETNEITRRAKAEASDIIEAAHQKAAQTTAAAQKAADDVTAQAQKWSHEMRTAASNYVEEIMKNSDEVLTANLSEIRRARQSLKSATISKENSMME